MKPIIYRIKYYIYGFYVFNNNHCLPSNYRVEEIQCDLRLYYVNGICVYSIQHVYNRVNSQVYLDRGWLSLVTDPSHYLWANYFDYLIKNELKFVYVFQVILKTVKHCRFLLEIYVKRCKVFLKDYVIHMAYPNAPIF